MSTQSSADIESPDDSLGTPDKLDESTEDDLEELENDDPQSKLEMFISYFPQILCLSIFLILVLLCIFKLEFVKMVYHSFINWIRGSPYTAVCAIIIFYTFTVSLNMPII